MVAVGGSVPDLEVSLIPRDPWPQGLGIFDLTEMQWRDDYDANADLYESPRMVKDGIAKEGMYPKKWDSPEVAGWLTGQCMWFYFSPLISPPPPIFSFLAHIWGKTPALADTPGTTNSPASSTGARGSNSGTGGINKGAIAGVVVASVVGAGLLLAGLIMTLKFLRKRKQRLHREALWSKNSYEKPELEAASAPPGSTQTWAPQSAHYKYAELNNNPLPAAETAAPNDRPVYETQSSMTTPGHGHTERHEMAL